MGQLDAQLEALLFASGKPVLETQLEQICSTDSIKIRAALKRLTKRYENGGLMLIESEEGWQIATKPEFSDLIHEYIGITPNTLSPAALEVLSIIAYSQPISKDQIDEIRGVASDQTLRLLLGRELIRARKSSRNTATVNYQTTPEFLQAAGIGHITELPKVGPDAK